MDVDLTWHTDCSELRPDDLPFHVRVPRCSLGSERSDIVAVPQECDDCETAMIYRLRQQLD